MRRQIVLSVLCVLLPIAAAAQVPPKPPVPPPPMAEPVPPVPMVAPMPPMPPMPWIDTMAIDDAMRVAREKMQELDIDALKRAASEQSLMATEKVRAMADQSRQLMEESKLFAMQDRAGQNMAFTMARGGSESMNYSSGLSLEDSKQFEKAIARFDQVVAQKSTRADAALYHKAYCQYRLGKTEDALATLSELRKGYDKSRYLNDAKVLEADVKKQSGHPVRPEDATDDDIKLLAIQGIQNSDPVRAIPLLQGVLTSNSAPSVKKRALYVLALSEQPEAHKILLDYAKGSGNPDLQRQAISYLASGGNRRQTTSAELMDIYNSTQDEDIKMAVLNALRSSGDTVNVMRLAEASSTPVVIRQNAIGGLGAADLWTLYQKEQNTELKMQMLGNFGSMGAIDQLTQVARTEKDPALKNRAIRSLGNMKAEKSGALLVELYGANADKETRKSVASALENQNNAEGLVAIARKETDKDAKLDIVRHLVNMAGHSKPAADYLMEIIK
jgi:HEAT repeat protein